MIYDVAYRIYETAGCVSSASEYGCGVYANALENVCQIKRHVKKLLMCTRCVYKVPFLMLRNSN